MSQPTASNPRPPSLFRSFGTVGSFTLFSRITGFIRDTLQANYLGAGALQDAFVFAFMFPNLFRRLFAEGAFSAGFVPIFAQLLEKEGQAKAKEFADQAFSLLAIILFVFCGVMILAMPAIYAHVPGFREVGAQVAHADELARIAFPYLFFISLVTLQSGVLNALHYFAAATFSQALLNITMIAFLLTGVAVEGDVAHFLCWGVFAAGVVQFLWVANACRRAGMGFKIVRPRFTPEIKSLFRRILPVVFGAGLYQINLLIDRIAAAKFVAVGAASWLYFADRVNQLPVGVIGVAAGIALVPLLTRQIQAGNEEGALANQNRAIEFCLLLTLPAAAGIGMLARPITSVLFERGHFLASDREMVAATLVAFSFGLPAYVLNKALTPGFFGRHDTKTPVKVAAVALVVNVILIAALLTTTRLGVAAIALASSLSAWINAGLLGLLLYTRGYLKPDARMRRRLPRMAVATFIMMIALWVGLAGVIHLFGLVFGAPGVPAGQQGLRALMLVALIVGGAVVYGVAAFMVGAAERNDLDNFKRKRDVPSAPTA